MKMKEMKERDWIEFAKKKIHEWKNTDKYSVYLQNYEVLEICYYSEEEKYDWWQDRLKIEFSYRVPEDVPVSNLNYLNARLHEICIKPRKFINDYFITRFLDEFFVIKPEDFSVTTNRYSWISGEALLSKLLVWKVKDINEAKEVVMLNKI